MSYEDELRASREHLRLGMTRAGRKYFDSSKLGEEVPEPYQLPDDAELTHNDFPPAMKQLADQHHVTFGEVRDMALRAHQRSGLGYSAGERAKVLNEVVLAMDGGRTEVPDEAILELTRQDRELSGRADTIGLAAMVPDAEHLAAAAVLHRSGHGEWADAAGLIASRAVELGVPDPLDGAVRASAATMQLALSMAAGEYDAATGLDGIDGEVARLTSDEENAHMFGLARHPKKSNVMVTTKTRAHSTEEDHQDTAQLAKGGSVHAKVRAIIEANPDLFTDGKGRDPSAKAGWPVPGVLSGAQREAGERRALAGGRPGGRSIRDLSRGAARTLGGTTASGR
jgi:hypothetical protein